MSGALLYPSYVDLDRLIDVSMLKSLDGYVRERLERRVSSHRSAAGGDTRFYTGPFLLNATAPTLPGSRMVYLSKSERADDYYDLDKSELWSRSNQADEFSELMNFIATLPFKSTGRMLIMYDPAGLPVTAHRDHDSVELCHDFIWFRTNLSKPFYLLDPETMERDYVAGYSAWFDTVNQYHGADGNGELSWSMRVDGQFADAFRAQIPVTPHNRASSPALWQQQIRETRLASSVDRRLADQEANS
jgi:hypothetical protein